MNPEPRIDNVEPPQANLYHVTLAAGDFEIEYEVYAFTMEQAEEVARRKLIEEISCTRIVMAGRGDA